MKFNQKVSIPSSKTGDIGGQALLDGPLDVAGFPKQKGSSSGKNGMKLRMELPEGCDCIKPITARVKSK